MEKAFNASASGKRVSRLWHNCCRNFPIILLKPWRLFCRLLSWISIPFHTNDLALGGSSASVCGGVLRNCCKKTQPTKIKHFFECIIFNEFYYIFSHVKWQCISEYTFPCTFGSRPCRSKCSSTLLTVPTVKNLKFQKSKMAAAAILKNLK